MSNLSDDLLNNLQRELDDATDAAYQCGFEDGEAQLRTITPEQFDAAASVIEEALDLSFSQGFEAGRHHQVYESDEFTAGYVHVSLADGDERVLPWYFPSEPIALGRAVEEIRQQLLNDELYRIGAYIGRSDEVERITVVPVA